MKTQLTLTACVLIITSCSQNNTENTSMTVEKDPPIAEKRPEVFEAHDVKRVDNYYWLNQREDTAVIDYLEAENAYLDAMMEHSKPLQESLFEEMKGRLNETESSAPYFMNGYWYYNRFEAGKDYRLYCRRKGTMEGEEEIFLNGNEMAEGHDYFAIADWDISPDNTMVMYGVDTVSRRKYTLYFKNLMTGEVSEENIPLTSGNAVWANDNKTIFFTTKNEETLRYERINRYEVGKPDSKTEIYFEEDDTYNTYVWKTNSKEFIVISSGSTLTSEHQILDANNPKGEFKMFAPREEGELYDISHQEDKFYITTNKDALNFKVMVTEETATDRANWQDFIAHRPETLVGGIDAFSDHIVIAERTAGKPNLRVMNNEGTDYYIEFPEEAYLAYTNSYQDYASDNLRLSYSSLTTPWTVYHYSTETREMELIKQEEVMGGGFSPENYTSERVMAPSHDGTLVPISLVYRKDLKKSEGNPTLLYGYGSYGAPIDLTFDSNRLSLLDRGFVYAIAHIRGGQMLGREWYEDGKMFKKMNTFLDFIACGEYMVENGYTESDQLYAMGGSAGGLLMGAVINLRPDLFNGVVAAVPFVDVITTMSDPSIPLTTGEYDEWGNPGIKDQFDYMLSYSPYDNVTAQAYPNLLVTTGLHDSQVQYFEPAKWVAKLRDIKTDDNVVLLHTNMEAGHGGASGRYNRLKERAMHYAFLVGLAEDQDVAL